MIRLVCEDGPGNESAMVLGPWECPYTILGSVPSPQWLSKCDVAVGADPLSRSDHGVHDSCSAQQCSRVQLYLAALGSLLDGGRRISPQLAKPADLSSTSRCKYLEPANLVILFTPILPLVENLLRTGSEIISYCETQPPASIG